MSNVMTSKKIGGFKWPRCHLSAVDVVGRGGSVVVRGLWWCEWKE